MSVLMCMPTSALADAYDANNYLPMDTTVKITETNLPIVFINTKTTDGNITIIHKDYRVPVRMTIINNADGKNYGDTLTHPGQHVDYDGWVSIKYRGNSSFDYAKKKPMGFKTLETCDVNGKKKKEKLLGMPKDKDWVLLAPYHDRSMIRDVLTFELARPYFEYTPRSRHCELVMDGIYRGIYILCERPGEGKNRLNLSNPGDQDQDITGDFLVEEDSNNEEHYYTSKYRALDPKGKELLFNSHVFFKYKFPEYDSMMPDHPAQLEYINNRISSFEDIMDRQDYADPQTGYRNYIDVTSFIDNMLSQEFSGNPDAYRRSTFIYKRRDDVDPRFKMCLWDFNMAYGNSLEELLGADKWHYTNNKATQMLRASHVPFWWARLMDDPYYTESLRQRWNEYRSTNYSEQRITALIDSLVNLLEVHGARERNYQAYPNWKENIFLNLNNTTNYEEEIASLRIWIADRLRWMDKQLGYNVEEDFVQQAKSEEAPGEWHDLHGRHISGIPTKKGLYICNGKKIMFW